MATHLATHSRVSWVTKIACFAKIKLKFRQFFKTFHFSSHHVFVPLSSPPLPLLKPPFSPQKPPFFSSIFTPNPRKGMCFHSFLLYFKFKAFYFMDLLVLLTYWNIVEEHGFCWEWRYNACFFMFLLRLLHAHALYNVLCCGVHTILLIKCLFRCFCVCVCVFFFFLGLCQVQNLGIIIFPYLEQLMVMCFTLCPSHDFMPLICTLFHIMRTHTIFDMCI